MMGNTCNVFVGLRHSIMRDAEQVVDAGRVLNFPDYSSFQSLK